THRPFLVPWRSQNVYFRDHVPLLGAGVAWLQMLSHVAFLPDPCISLALAPRLVPTPSNPRRSRPGSSRRHKSTRLAQSIRSSRRWRGKIERCLEKKARTFCPARLWKTESISPTWKLALPGGRRRRPPYARVPRRVRALAVTSGLHRRRGDTCFFPVCHAP